MAMTIITITIVMITAEFIIRLVTMVPMIIDDGENYGNDDDNGNHDNNVNNDDNNEMIIELL